jgi:outer membrane protein assembly factor BamB
MAGKKTFLCYAAEDEHRVPALLAALDAWDVSFHLLSPTQQPAEALRAETANEIRGCEAYIRVCTSATRGSPQVALADETFLKLLETDRRGGNWEKRKLVNLIFDPAYPLDEQERATLYIETAGKTRALWLEQLAVPLGVATLKQRISRRALVGTGIGASLAVAFGGTLAAVLIQQQRQREESQRTLPNTRSVSGQPSWTIPLAGFVDDQAASVTVDITYEDGTLYAIANDGGSIGVYSLSPGQRSAHRLPLDPSPIEQNPISSVYLRGRALFVTYDTQVNNTSQPHNIVFSLRAGSLAYRLDTGNIGIPTVVGNNFYAVNFSQSGDPFISAFRLQDGGRIWQQPISLDPTSYTHLDGVDIVSVSHGLVYVSTFDHTVSCFDAGTGDRRWKFDLTGQATAPVVSGGSVYFGVWDGAIYSLDAATGSRRWRSNIGETLSVAPTIDGSTMYITSMDGYLHAVDASSGALYWRSVLGSEKTNTAPINLVFPPVVYHNVVAVASEVPGTLFTYDLRDGSLRWRYTPLGIEPNLYQPLLYNGLVVVGAEDGRVYALNP